MTFIAILSVCFIINLPGVAIAPVEGKLMKTLGTSELEIQLLTTLPNFIIIPFVLLAGKLSAYRHKMWLIVVSLLMFFSCGVAYMLAQSMKDLIIISCFLGCADGMLIPFAMGFIVNTFDGKYRTRTLGIKSATSNLGMVLASVVIEFLIDKSNWHLPFCVYLIAALPLFLCLWLYNVPGFGKNELTPSFYQDTQENGKDLEGGKIWSMIANNVIFSFLTFSIIIYLPQLIEDYGWNAKISADLTAVFFLFVLAAGFVLTPFMRIARSALFPILGASLMTGLALITFIKSEWAMYVACILGGLAFGIFQPLIYDKTSYAVKNPKKNILGLSMVLTALYMAIAVEPFVIT